MNMAILALLYCSIRHSRESGNPGGQGRGGCSWTSAETLVTSSRRELTWPTAGDMRNVGFTEFCRLVEAFGFKLRRVSGSHHIYRHPEVPRPLPATASEGSEALSISQFLDIVEEHGLKMERRR